MIKKKYLLNKKIALRIGAILVFCSLFVLSYAQENTIQFRDSPLNKVIQTIEKETGSVINHSPDLLRTYSFSGEVNIDDLSQALSKVLYETPFAPISSESSFLIYEVKPEKYRVCGTVIDAENSESLIAANVIAQSTNIGSQTNGTGFFDFEILCTKNQRIEISYLGYETKSFMVQDQAEGVCPTYSMTIDRDLMGKEIIIQDYILDGITQGDAYGSFALNFDQLSRNHSNVEHDILKTAQLLPGINSIDDSATNLQIRGSSPDHNLILWDGVPLYNSGHIFGMISAINPFSVDEVRIFKGAHDPKYDNRVGGVIDISLTDSITNSFHGSVGSTLTEVHTNLDIPIIDNRVSLILSGRHSINGIYESPALESYTENVFQQSTIGDQSVEVSEGIIDASQSLDYNDWNAKMLYQASDLIRVNLGVYQNQQNFEYSFSFPEDPFLSTDEIAVDTEVINADVDLSISDHLSSKFSFYTSKYRNLYQHKEFEADVFSVGYDQYNSIDENSFKVANNYSPTSIINLQAGYEYNTKRVNLDLGDVSSFGTEFLEPIDERASFHNLFLSTALAFKGLKIDAGTRATYHQTRAQWAHSPRASLQYSVNDQWSLKADAGVYHQFISQLIDFEANQIRIDNPLWILNTSETQLSQKANKLAAGFVYHHNGWLLDVDAYYNYTTALSTVSPVLRYLEYGKDFLLGNYKARGIDLLLKKRWSNVNTWINYSLGRIVYEFPEISNSSFLAPNDIRHNFNLVTSYRIKKIQLSLNANYHSGLPYSQPQVVPNEEDPDAVPPFNYFLEYDELNNNRLAPYFRLDFNLNYRTTIKRLGNSRLEISLTVMNLLNRENNISREHYLDFDETNEIPDIEFIGKVLLDRTPLLLFRIEF